MAHLAAQACSPCAGCRRRPTARSAPWGSGEASWALPSSRGPPRPRGGDRGVLRHAEHRHDPATSAFSGTAATGPASTTTSARCSRPTCTCSTRTSSSTTAGAGTGSSSPTATPTTSRPPLAWDRVAFLHDRLGVGRRDVVGGQPVQPGGTTISWLRAPPSDQASNANVPAEEVTVAGAETVTVDPTGSCGQRRRTRPPASTSSTSVTPAAASV